MFNRNAFIIRKYYYVQTGTDVYRGGRSVGDGRPNTLRSKGCFFRNIVWTRWCLCASAERVQCNRLAYVFGANGAYCLLTSVVQDYLDVLRIIHAEVVPNEHCRVIERDLREKKQNKFTFGPVYNVIVTVRYLFKETRARTRKKICTEI